MANSPLKIHIWVYGRFLGIHHGIWGGNTLSLLQWISEFIGHSTKWMNIIMKELSTDVETWEGYSEERKEGHLSHTEEWKDLPVGRHVRTETTFLHCHIPSVVQVFTQNVLLSPCNEFTLCGTWKKRNLSSLRGPRKVTDLPFLQILLVVRTGIITSELYHTCELKLEVLPAVYFDITVFSMLCWMDMLITVFPTTVQAAHGYHVFIDLCIYNKEKLQKWKINDFAWTLQRTEVAGQTTTVESGDKLI